MMGADQTLPAFYNVCQHRAHELLPPGTGNVGSLLVCPYHAWAYKTEGTLHGTPRSNNRHDFDKADYPLKGARLEVFLSCVFINLDDDATPLSEQAADLEADIRERVPYLDDLKAPTTGMLGDGHTHAG